MLSDNRNRYDETMTYDNNGNVTKLHRCGKMQKSTNGNVDELTTMEYSGNQLTARRYHYQRDVVASRDVGVSPAIMLNPERGDYDTLVVSRSVLSGSTKLMFKGPWASPVTT